MQAEIHRSIARVAARNAFRCGNTEDCQLMDEARMTDRFSCSEADMLTLLHAELARVKGAEQGWACDRRSPQEIQHLITKGKRHELN